MGYAVYLWHCDREGEYSMYTGPDHENYLRGVQATDTNGSVTFTTIFPAGYSGRWPHIHFEVYPTLAARPRREQDRHVAARAARGGVQHGVRDHRLQPERHEPRGDVAARDNVFSDGVTLQTPRVTGNTTAGYVATLLVAV